MSSICAPSKKKPSHSYCHIITHHCPRACHINIDEKTAALSVSLWMSLWWPNEDLWQVPHKPPSHGWHTNHRSASAPSKGTETSGTSNKPWVGHCNRCSADAMSSQFLPEVSAQTTGIQNQSCYLIQRSVCVSVPLMVVPEKVINMM